MLSVLLTFLCVVVAWVFFRATTLEGALRVLAGMSGLNGVVLPLELRPAAEGLFGAAPAMLGFAVLEATGGWRQLGWIVALLAIAWATPNSQSLMSAVALRVNRWRGELRAWMLLGAAAVVMFLLAAISGSHGSSEFIYFNF